MPNKTSDVLKRLLETSVNTLVFTEENFRNIISELKLPKEAVGSLLQLAKGSKDELVTKLVSEFQGLSSKINLKKEIIDILNELSMDLHTTVTFHRKNKRPKP